MLSATGANTGLLGFTTRNLNRHFGVGEKNDHSGQYPQFTKEQYAQRALELASSPVGKNVLGYKALRGIFKGSIVRYDILTNDWVRGTPSGIATMFKPDDGAAYFERIKIVETGR